MGSDLQLAWRNLWRNRRRSILSICGIAFAAAILVLVLSFQANQYQLMLRSAVNSGTGYLQVMAEDFRDDAHMWLVLEDPAAIESALRAEPRVVQTTPRSEGFSLFASDDHSIGALVIGVRAETEPGVTNVVPTVREGAFLGSEDFDVMVIGSLLARNLGVGVGGEITILGSARDGSVAAGRVRIKGIFESGQNELDRSLGYVPLEYFDEVFRMDGAVHRIVVRADGLWWLGELAQRLTGMLRESHPGAHPPVAWTWNDLLPGLLDAIKLDFAFAVVMYSILVLVVAFSILNTFIMAVFERTREFGVMMAIGTTPGRLVRVVMIESVMLAWLGALAGVVLGSLVTMWLARVGIDFGKEAGDYMAQYGLPPRVHPELSVATAVIGPSIVFVVTIFSALLPALRVQRMRPVEAIHAP